MFRSDDEKLQQTYRNECQGLNDSPEDGESKNSASQSENKSTASQQNKETRQANGQNRKRKRQSQDGNDDDDYDESGDRNPKRPKNLSANSPAKSDARKFACPYRKHDARKYCVRSWRSCALTPLDTVARVK